MPSRLYNPHASHKFRVGPLYRRKGQTKTMSTYKLQDMTLHTRRIIVNQREFVSWTNVWLFTQVLVAINALVWSFSQGIRVELLVCALVATWLIWTLNRF